MSQSCVMLHNGSEINKTSMGELFHVIYFHQIEQPRKYFDHKKWNYSIQITAKTYQIPLNHVKNMVLAYCNAKFSLLKTQNFVSLTLPF